MGLKESTVKLIRNTEISGGYSRHEETGNARENVVIKSRN
jgi:hypothetical protein